jgi:hypothetical protein
MLARKALLLASFCKERALLDRLQSLQHLSPDFLLHLGVELPGAGSEIPLQKQPKPPLLLALLPRLQAVALRRT